MEIPKFLLADNSKYPEDIFILHTEFPRFMINLKDDEIDQMIKDAEQNASEDKKRKESIEVKNKADALIGRTRDA